MNRSRTSWLSIFAIAAIVLLLFGATAGSVWHNHADEASAAQCKFCQLGHLPAEQPIVAASIHPHLRVVGVTSPEKQTEFFAAPPSNRPSRAPPSQA